MRRLLLPRVLICSLLACSMLMLSAPGVAVAVSNPWHWLNPLPNGNNVNAVCMAPGSTSVVWAVGDYGTVIKSYDNGASWMAKSSGTSQNLMDVDFISADAGWAVGNAGTIVRITGGASCSAQTWGTGIHLDAVDAVDATNAWAVGTAGTVARTVNGTDWTAVSFPVSVDLRAVQFSSATEGYVAGDDNTIYYTNDAGASWQAKATADADFDIWDIAVSGSTIWVVGMDGSYQPKFYVATDGGTFYAPVPPMTTANGYLTSVCYLDATHVWVATSAGEVLFSNGGAWTEQASPYDGTWLGDIDFRNATTGVCVGGVGAIGRTANGGALWTKRAMSPDGSISAVEFSSVREGMAVSGSDALVTTNYGQSWTTIDTGSPYNLLDIDMLDAKNGWIAGDVGILIKVGWNGSSHTFTKLNPAVTTQTLFSVSALDATHAWACGYNGTVVRTTNGTTWAPVTTGTTQTLHGIDFFDALHGIAVGADGAVIYTSDGGTTWSPGVSGSATYLNAVEMVSPTVGYAVGNAWNPYPGMHMLKTTDGGATWTFMTPPTGMTWRDLYSVRFVDANNGWIVGGQGTIIKTTDGGTTWTDQQMSMGWFFDVSAVSPSAAWAVGSTGAIVSTHYPQKTVVYRFYHMQKGTHFYTTDYAEKQKIINTMSNIYKYEGVGYEYDPYYAPDQLHRFYNFKNGTHFYTADYGEYLNTLNNLKATYSYDGPAYNVSRAAVPGKPVWRFYNNRVGSHFYTADPTEKANVQNNLGQYFSFEGIAFYLPE